MSTTSAGAGVIAGGAMVARRVRAFFAPVDRVSGTVASFNPAALAGNSLSAMPAPWVDVGRCLRFVRKAETQFEALRSGSPPSAREQVKTHAGAQVQLEFEQWGKLQIALSAGVQQLNLLQPGLLDGAQASAGASAAAALTVGATGSSASALQLADASAAPAFAAGQIVAVDVDYTGQTGFLGSGAAGTYVATGSPAINDVDYVRRITLNVGVVTSVANGTLTLASPLLAGAPVAGMRVSPVLGFLDREGGSFSQEWSAIFCLEGEQGDRMFFHYPRLQAMSGISEASEVLAEPLEQIRPRGSFRALAVQDATDGTMVLCYRSYFPAPMRAV